jgi:hypothetical protein
MESWPVARRTEDQLVTLGAIGLYDTPLAGHSGQLATLAVAAQDVEGRARGYLEAKCAHCHRLGTPVASDIDLRYGISFPEMNVCNVEPVRDEWRDGAAVLVPSAPELSLISIRPHSTDPDIRMPQIGSRVVDEAGVAAIDAWVQGISSCPAP